MIIKFRRPLVHIFTVSFLIYGNNLFGQVLDQGMTGSNDRIKKWSIELGAGLGNATGNTAQIGGIDPTQALYYGTVAGVAANNITPFAISGSTSQGTLSLSYRISQNFAFEGGILSKTLTIDGSSRELVGFAIGQGLLPRQLGLLIYPSNIEGYSVGSYSGGFVGAKYFLDVNDTFEPYLNFQLSKGNAQVGKKDYETKLPDANLYRMGGGLRYYFGRTIYLDSALYLETFTGGFSATGQSLEFKFGKIF